MKSSLKSNICPATITRFGGFFFIGTISCNNVSKKGLVTAAHSKKTNYRGLVGSFLNSFISTGRTGITVRSRKASFTGLVKNPQSFWAPGGRILSTRLAVMAFFFIMLSGITTAQEYPPRPIVVVPTGQTLSFGAFTPGATGGTVTVNPEGTRSSIGTVILLNLGSFIYSSAGFDITANPGTLISILNSTPVLLPGSGGGSMTLTIGSTTPVSPFVTSAVPPLTTPLYIGGTLTVGNILANPPGSYSGSFNITFVQE